jgi:hypothetical protein
MRTIFIVDHPLPPTEGDLAAAADAGASEVFCGIPAALADLGISTFGYHEIADPPAPVPQLIEMRKAVLEMDATEFGEGTLLEATEALVAASPRAVQLEWARATHLSRTRDVVIGMQAALSISDETMDALFIAANARP